MNVWLEQYHPQITWTGKQYALYQPRNEKQILYESWIRDVLEKWKKPMQFFYKEKDLWFFYQQTIACRRGEGVFEESYLVDRKEEREEYQKEWYHSWRETRKKGDISWKKIQKWFLNHTFDSEKEIRQYVQWISEMWNVPIVIWEGDRFETIAKTVKRLDQLPIFFQSDRSSLEDPSDFLPLFYCFRFQGSWWIPKENPFLPPFLF